MPGRPTNSGVCSNKSLASFGFCGLLWLPGNGGGGVGGVCICVCVHVHENM